MDMAVDSQQEEEPPVVGGTAVMLYLIIGYLVMAFGTFTWASYHNWANCFGLEDCLLTLVANIAWGGIWPIYWWQQIF